jgi:PleD family two-component response regulator
VQASLGLAMRKPEQGLRAAWEEADAEMYREKSSRQH